MVEIIAGSGLGLERTSASILGGAGTLGNAATGTANVGVVVNAQTGNLVVQSAGEKLDGVSDGGDLNAVVGQTYNSLGVLNGTNNNAAWAGQSAELVNATGTVNAAGSTVQRIDWDGSLVTYTYSSGFLNTNGTYGAYVVKEASGPDDSITWANSTWQWHAGTTGATETYNNPGTRISSRTDLHGNTETFTYTGTLLTQITTADGEYVSLIYSGNNLVQLTTHGTNVQTGAATTLTRTYYAYDSQNRLTSTTVDLSPNDNSIADGNVYKTTYSYVGTTNLIASVTQTDGSSVSFTYDAQNRVASYTQAVNANANRTTTLSYGTGSTTITDPQGNQTALFYNGPWLVIAAPPAVAGGKNQISAFNYDSNGNVTASSVFDGWANHDAGVALTQTINTFDGNGNLLTSADLLGNTTSYTYDQFNNVLTKTDYTVPNSGGGAGGAQTTRYAYETGSKSLRYTVSAAGDVTFYNHHLTALVETKLVVTTRQYNTAGLAATASISTAALDSWITALTSTDRLALQRTDYTHDFRGNLASEISYSATDATGSGLLTSPYTQTHYVYDQAGELLQKLINTGGTTVLSNSITQWGNSGTASQAVAAINGQPATQFTMIASGTNAAAYGPGATANAGDTVTTTLSLLGVGSLTSASLGIWGAVSGWNASGLGTAVKVSGPGTVAISRYGAGLWTVSGLSTTLVTTIEFTRVFVQTEGFGVNLYANLDHQVAGDAVIATAPAITIDHNAVSSSTYDGLGRVLSQTDANGNRITTGYNSVADQITTTDATGAVNTMLYDLAGELISSTTTGTGISATTQYVYDSESNLRETVDPAGVKNYFIYDSENRKVGAVDGNGVLTETQYDAADRAVASVTYATPLGAAQLQQLAAVSPTVSNTSLGNWTISNLTSTPTTLNGAAANSYAVVTTGSWAPVYSTFTAAAGDTVTSTFTLEAGTSTTASLGINGNVSSWGANNFSNAAILSGPGTLVQNFGGYWSVTGLSATQATTITVTRTFTRAEYGAIYLAVDWLNGTIAGHSVIASKPIVTQSSNVALASVRPAGNAADAWSWNIYDAASRLTETISAVGTVTTFSYDGTGALIQQTSYANPLSPAQISSLIATPPTSQILPTANAALDRTTRDFYSTDGQLIGSLDAQGYLTRIDYDNAGRRAITISYATAASASLTATGTFAQLLASIAPTGQDQWTLLHYDNEGRLVLEARAAESSSVSSTYYTYNARNQVATAQTIVGINFGTNSTAFSASYYLATYADIAAAHIDPLAHYLAYGWYEGRWPSATLTPAQAYAQYGIFTATTSYSYDADGHLISLTAAAGSSVAATTSYTYDGDGRVLTTTNPRSMVTANHYDALGRLTSRVVDPTGLALTTSFTYDVRGNKISETDPNGNTAYFYYDTDDRLIVQVDPDGYATRTNYLLGNTVASVTHYATQATGSYNGVVSPTIVASANDATTSFAYDAAGRLIGTTDAGGLSESYMLDSFGDRTLVTNKLGGITANVYDRRGLLLSEAITENSTTTGGATEATSVTNAYSYDAFGNRITQVEAQGLADSRTITHTYDTFNRLTAKSLALGAQGNAVTTYQYDVNGNLVLTTDANGNKTYDYYDVLNRKVAEVNAVGVLTSYNYDLGNNLLSQRTYATPLSLSSLTVGGFPPLPNLIPNADFAQGLSGWFVGANGSNILAAGSPYTGTNVNGTGTNCIKAEFTATAAGQIVSLATSTSVPVIAGDNLSVQVGIEGQGVTGRQDLTVWFFDANGNRVGGGVGVASASVQQGYNSKIGGFVTVPQGAVTMRLELYANTNGAGWGSFVITQPMVSAVPAGQAGFPTFTANGNDRAALATGNYRETDYAYDRNNRQLYSAAINVVDGFWNGSIYTTQSGSFLSGQNVYDANGNIIETISANGYKAYDYYDKAGHKIASVDGDGYLTAYVLDQNGNVTQETRYATAVSGATTGSSVAGLIAAAGNGANAKDRVTQFTYDKTGNRLTETRLNVAYATASTTSDSITTATANAAVTYTYNALGEVLTKREATGDTTTYSYDAQGRLLTSVNATGLTTQNSYDGLNNVTRNVASGANSATRVTTYYYGAGGRLAATNGSGINAAESVQNSNYYYDLVGNLTNQNVITNASINDGAFSYYFNYDGLNRAVGETPVYWTGSAWVTGDGNGVIYDAYGEVVAQTLNGTRTTQSIYDNSGHVVASNSGDGTWKAYVNDSNGNATLTIQSTGTADLSSFLTTGLVNGIDTSTYNQAGALALATNNGANTAGAAAGNGVEVTIAGFDQRNQQLYSWQMQRTVDTSVNVYTITASASYDAFGDVVSQTDARNNTTSFAYNAEGKITSQINPQVSIASGNGTSALGNPTSYDYYDLSGRLVATKDADGNLTTRALLAGTGYGGTQALETAEFHPDGGIVRSTYDAYGDVLTHTDALGYVTTNAYDNSGNLIQVTDPRRTTNTDGSAGDGSQLINYYSYDAVNQQVGQWNSLLGSADVQTTAYDAQGRVIATTDFVGHTTKDTYTWNLALTTSGLYTYGGWTKTTTDVDAGVSSVSSTDAFGHQIGKTDFGGHVYAFTYNKAGELVTQTDSATNQSVKTNGSTTSVSTGGESLTYTYYSNGKVATITDNSGSFAGYYTTGLKSTFSYDYAGNRLTSNYTATSLYAGNIYGYSYSYTTVTNLENSTATYDALNRIVSITDPGATSRPSFTQTKSYDANGNIIENKTVHQNLSTSQALSAATTDDYWFAYDSLNRVVVSEGELSGAAGAGTTVVSGTSGSLGDAKILARTSQNAGTSITYNTDGEEATSTTYATQWVTHNIRYSKYNTQPVSASYAQEIEQIYAYDAQGSLVTTNVAANSATFTNNSPSATLTVTALGTAVAQASYARDTLGRVLQQTEYATTASDTSGATLGQAIYSHSYAYNADSQITGDNVSVLGYNTSAGTVTNTLTGNTFTYGVSAAGAAYVAGDYADGNVVSQNTSTYTYTGSTLHTGTPNNGGTNIPTTSTGIATSNSYLWFDAVQQASITATYTGSQTGTTTSVFDYDHNGHVSEVITTGTGAHTNTYVTSAAGYVMENQELTSGGTSAPETYYFYFNNQQIGQIGNNGTTNVNYSGSVTNQTSSNSGPFTSGTGSTGAQTANFDANSNPISATGNGSAPAGSSYTVQNGDTLASIASNVYGDANLWYVIAQANGLSAGSSLAAGQQITIPNTVVNAGNTSGTFRPYNSSAALGDVQPGAPVPPAQNGGGGCGIIGEILLVVVAVVVAIELPEVAGSIFGQGGLLGAGLGNAVVTGVVASAVSQGVGLATGIQSSFSFGQLALAGLSAGVGFGVGQLDQASGGVLGSSGVAGSALRGLVGNAVTQGIGVATGLQSSFDWAGVAAAGIGAGVGSAFGASSFGKSLGKFGDQVVSGAAGGIASAATRSVLTGTDFGDNIIATLPSAIANTIGNLVASGITQAGGGAGLPGRVIDANGDEVILGPDVTPHQAAAAQAMAYQMMADTPALAGGDSGVLLAGNTDVPVIPGQQRVVQDVYPTGFVPQTTIDAIPGYPQTGSFTWRSANDSIFLGAVNQFNSENGLSPGDAGYWTADLLKAQSMIESGGTKSAFLTDPLQVNNPKDWPSDGSKLNYTDLTGPNEQMNPQLSATAALQWMDYKGWRHDASGNETSWKGYFGTLEAYNGNNHVEPGSGGLPNKIWYANTIISLAAQAKK